MGIKRGLVCLYGSLGCKRQKSDNWRYKMKKIAILIGLGLILATAVVLWAQRQPNDLRPASGFYGHITYNGCNCYQGVYVFIMPEGGNTWTRYRIQRCGGDPGYTTYGQEPEKWIQGWYYLKMDVPTGGGCEDDAMVHVWHSGMEEQRVDFVLDY
jgi:hypothetical protein